MNVQIGDVTILVPVSVAANLCDVNLNVLAEQRRTGGATCEATAESIASPGRGEAGGGGHQAGNSLVNVQVGDITVLLPLAVAANVCDVNVNVLAQQLRQGARAATHRRSPPRSRRSSSRRSLRSVTSVKGLGGVPQALLALRKKGFAAGGLYVAKGATFAPSAC